jgi:hypothetical protein
VQDAVTKAKFGAVQGVKFQPVFIVTLPQRTGHLHLSRHSCKFSAGYRNTEEYIHPSPSRIPPQRIND